MEVGFRRRNSRRGLEQGSGVGIAGGIGKQGLGEGIVGGVGSRVQEKE